MRKQAAPWRCIAEQPRGARRWRGGKALACHHIQRDVQQVVAFGNVRWLRLLVHMAVGGRAAVVVQLEAPCLRPLRTHSPCIVTAHFHNECRSDTRFAHG